jgi:hypothetical protein
MAILNHRLDSLRWTLYWVEQYQKAVFLKAYKAEMKRQVKRIIERYLSETS